jgi:hypothetical protein
LLADADDRNAIGAAVDVLVTVVVAEPVFAAVSVTQTRIVFAPFASADAETVVTTFAGAVV